MPDESTWTLVVGDVVAYATRQTPGTKPRPNATGTITRVAAGPAGAKMLEIDQLRLQTEVRRA